MAYHEVKGTFRYPSDLDDHEAIRQYAGDVIGSNRYFRHEIERAALRNVLYFLGVQWIKYDPELRIWRPLGLKKATPRPVTNKLASLINTTVSSLVSYRVPITYGPASFDDDDVAAANVADRINDIIEKEVKVRSLKPTVARWIALTGNCFLINNYDTSTDSGTVFIQFEQDPAGHVKSPLEIEEAGGVCEECGGPVPWAPAPPKEDGTPQGIELPRGRFHTEIKPLFSCYFDQEAPTLNESSYFLVSELKGRDFIERLYGAEVAQKAAEAPHSEPYTNYVETLAYSTAIGGRIWGQVTNQRQQRVRVRRLWLHPHPVYAPKGIYAVLVGDQVVEAKEWSYHNEKGEPFLNVVHMGFDPVPGRLLYKTRCDDVAVKQEQRNRIEAIVELHSIRMANSIWLVPGGSGIQRITGEQGQFITYNAMAGVPAPTRVPGDPGNPYLMNWMLQMDQEMDMLMGLSEVARGEAPRGVSAYAALQLLDERAQAGQSNLLDNWSLGWMEWSKQMLNIWREYADEERVSSAGAGRWAMEKFSSAQLEGGVDISVELGQNKPRTQVGRRAVADQAIRLGLANPFVPYERIRLLELIGIPELMEDFKIDQQRAAEENDQFLAGELVPPPYPWDNHDAHILSHRRLTYSDTFRDSPPEMQMALIEHMNLHWMVLSENAAKPRKTGSVAPGGGENKGTAEGGGGTSEGATDEEQIDLEGQMASPDTNVGRPGER